MEEIFEEYYAALRKLSRNCNFGNIKEWRLIRDCIIAGVYDKKTSSKITKLIKINIG